MLRGSRTNARRTRPQDMWIFACAVHHLFADLFLFPINAEGSEFQQLTEIFRYGCASCCCIVVDADVLCDARLLGTPDKSSWPGLERLQNWSWEFAQFESTYDEHFANTTVESSAVIFMKVRVDSCDALNTQQKTRFECLSSLSCCPPEAVSLPSEFASGRGRCDARRLLRAAAQGV